MNLRFNSINSSPESRPQTARGYSLITTSVNSNDSYRTNFCSSPDMDSGIATKLTPSSSLEQDAKLLQNLRRPQRTEQVFPPVEQDDRIDNYLSELADMYKINRDLVERLRILEHYEIVILCDDSGSMNTPIDDTGKTRWQELKEIVKVILHIGTVFDENGVDVYFLNRPKELQVTDPGVIDKAFAKRPHGYSRLAPALEYIFNSGAAKFGADKQLLVFVATDAEPTDESDKADLSSLEKVMREVRNSKTTYVMFLLCNNKPECFKYMSEWDKNMENVDVTVDFVRQKKQVHERQGANYPFSFGDYIVKALLGAIDPEMDALGE